MFLKDDRLFLGQWACGRKLLSLVLFVSGLAAAIMTLE